MLEMKLLFPKMPHRSRHQGKAYKNNLLCQTWLMTPLESNMSLAGYARAQFSSLLSTPLQELARCWVGRIEPQHLGKMLPSLSEPALLGQGNAQIVVSAHIVGPEPQCLGIMLNGLVEAALVGQGNPQVITPPQSGGLDGCEQP